MAKVWWVNQRNEIKGEIPTNVVWSPYAVKGDKGEKWHWKTMWDVAPGDIILHYSHQCIVAISTALTEARPAPNPYPSESNPWVTSGKRIEVEIHDLEVPIGKSEIPLDARKQAYENHGPFIKSGEKVKQGYFFPVPSELWSAIQELCNVDIEASGDNPYSLDFEGPSDIKTTVNARKEQTQLRALLLKGEDMGSCGICGRCLPSRYLHAAHIKPRNDATESERHDPNIAMLDCVLGCDEAFECGDIRIDADGRISLADPINPALRETFGYLIGKTAPAFNDKNKQYFIEKYKIVCEAAGSEGAK